MMVIKRIASSLRAKLLLMFVILTCFPLISVGLISYHKSYTAVYNNGKASAMLTGEQLAAGMDSLFKDTAKLLELEKNPSVLQFLFSQINTYEDAKDILNTMASYRQTYQYNDVLNITMINLYGRGISERKGVFQLEHNVLSHPHLSYLLRHPDEVLNIPPSDAAPIGRLDGSQDDGKQVISMIATVKQRITHEVIGFIIIDLDSRTMSQLSHTNDISKGGYFFIVDQAGKPIFIPNTASLLEPESIRPLLNGTEDHMTLTLEGKSLFVFASPLATAGWGLIGVIPLQSVAAEAGSIRQLIVVSVVLSIAFAITLHYFITRRLTRPIRRLKKNMQLAASGHLEAKVTPEGSDEIADLGTSFNTMLVQIRYLLNQRIKEQQAMKKAELRALQAQINPHFLYNTLESIIWMAEAGKKEHVITLVQSLSRLFRISLSQGKDWIPVAKEVEHLQSYLTIQQMRYRDILNYEINVSPEILEYSILKMTLQPLVENALYHGIKNKRGQGSIRIEGRLDSNSHLIFTVEDNGVGMSEERLEQLVKQLDVSEPPEQTGNEVSGGFGLYNVHQRIHLYYGEVYGVRVESIHQEGTRVTVRVPCRTR